MGRLFGLPVSAVGRRSFGRGPDWGLFGLYPFRPFGRPEFRPGRRGEGGSSDTRTWPIRELGGVAGDPVALTRSHGKNRRCDQRRATESGNA